MGQCLKIKILSSCRMMSQPHNDEILTPQMSNLGQGHILGQCPKILSSCRMMSHNDEILTPQMSGFKSGAGAHYGTVSQNQNPILM